MMQQMLLGYTTDQGPGFTTYVVRQDSTQGGGCYIDLGANLFTSSSPTYTVEVWCRPLTTPNGEGWVIDQHPGGSGRLIIGCLLYTSPSPRD